MILNSVYQVNMGNQATKAKKNVILHQIKPNTVSKTLINLKCNIMS